MSLGWAITTSIQRYASTAIECNQIFSLRASAGIVSDSVIEGEYIETLHKMGSVFKAITNEEISCHVV